MPAAYRTVALLMRYPLAALGVLIALRGAYMALVDLRRAARIRRQEGRDSAVAVLFCLPSDREGKGKRVPLTRSGCVGSSGSADVSVKDCGLNARHFEYDIRDGMMEVRPLPGAKVSVEPVAMVAVIGTNMKIPGFLSKAAKALSDAKINTIAIVQSPRQVNMQFIVRRDDFQTAQLALHKVFVEDQQ